MILLLQSFYQWQPEDIMSISILAHPRFPFQRGINPLAKRAPDMSLPPTSPESKRNLPQ
jgi:hypothetical protein